MRITRLSAGAELPAMLGILAEAPRGRLARPQLLSLETPLDRTGDGNDRHHRDAQRRSEPGSESAASGYHFTFGSAK